MSNNLSELELAEIIAANPDLARRNGARLARTGNSLLSDLNRPSLPVVPSEAEKPVRANAVSRDEESSNWPPLTFTVFGAPIPKPRQTRSDKWKKRPSVLRYRKWADNARAADAAAKRARFPDVRFLGTVRHGRIRATAFFALPASWNAVTKAKMRGKPHCQRPDADNLLKALGDSLFPTGDEHLYDLQISKYWDDGEGPRMVVMLF